MKKTEPIGLIIFGASGDLTFRKLIPAIYNLFCQKYLPDNFFILGISRSKYTDDAYRERVVFQNEFLSGKSQLAEFSKLVHYVSLDPQQQSEYVDIKNFVENRLPSRNRNLVFYLSTPPKLYPEIFRHLHDSGLSDTSDGWRRIIIEKPFGYDLTSAKSLNNLLKSLFKEEQIYNIDHYLGKETVQNLWVTRFANSIFEPLWNRNYIHRVEVTAAEQVGVEDRGGYYDSAGALRDMVQNHLLQLVSLVAMEPPVKIEANAIRHEKLKVFQSLRPIHTQDIPNQVVRGQYIESHYRGKTLPGYRNEQGVNPESRTETFVAMKFFIDNWRWADVPFYMRTGKRMPTRVSEVVVHFKPNHHHLFGKSRLKNNQNMLVFRIQPDEGILLKFGLKVPGNSFEVQPTNMDFLYKKLTDKYIPEAYERLILDCFHGDQTLFAKSDSLEATWKFVDPILDAWQNDPSIPLYGYPAGTWGPEQADDLITGEDMSWRYPCKNLVDDDDYCEL